MLCDIWTGQFINILGNIMMFHAAKFHNFRSHFSYLTESTAKAPFTAFARIFSDILPPKKIWI